ACGRGTGCRRRASTSRRRPGRGRRGCGFPWCRVGFPPCAWMSGERRDEGLEQAIVLVGGSDREPQAVLEQGMRAVEIANQYTTLPQPLEGARRVRDAHEHE